MGSGTHVKLTYTLVSKPNKDADVKFKGSTCSDGLPDACAGKQPLLQDDGKVAKTHSTSDFFAFFQPTTGSDARYKCAGGEKGACNRDVGTFTVKLEGTNDCSHDYDTVSVQCICPKVAIAQIKPVVGCKNADTSDCTQADTA